MNCARRTSSRSSKPRLHSQAPGVVDISHLIKDINGEHTRDGGLTRVAQKCHITSERELVSQAIVAPADLMVKFRVLLEIKKSVDRS